MYIYIVDQKGIENETYVQPWIFYFIDFFLPFI